MTFLNPIEKILANNSKSKNNYSQERRNIFTRKFKCRIKPVNRPGTTSMDLKDFELKNYINSPVANKSNNSKNSISDSHDFNKRQYSNLLK